MCVYGWVVGAVGVRGLVVLRVQVLALRRRLAGALELNRQVGHELGEARQELLAARREAHSNLGATHAAEGALEAARHDLEAARKVGPWFFFGRC